MQILSFVLMAGSTICFFGCDAKTDSGARESAGQTEIAVDASKQEDVDTSKQEDPVRTLQEKTAEPSKKPAAPPQKGKAGKAGAMEGMWRPYKDRSPEIEPTEEQKELLERLEAIGYAAGSTAPPVKKNVTLHKKDRAYQGMNLYASGHGPEAILIDMSGKELHKWRYEFERIWPDREMPFAVKPQNQHYWRRAHLMENGDLLAIFEGYGLIRLDKDSKLIWAYPGKCHHDLHVVDNQKIYVLAREGTLVISRGQERPALIEYITVLDMQGNELNKVSLEECFVGTEFEPLLKKVGETGDRFHTNTIEVLDGRLEERSPVFKKGNIIVSICKMSTVVVIDPEIKKVVWAVSDQWKYQHQPTVLDNGNMLIFDNLGFDNHSRVVEFDPVTLETVWQYNGDPPDSFHSTNLGSCQRLPNGNTLITESDYGRAFEVDQRGETVWEFLNPHRAGQGDIYIATLFELIRLPADFHMDW